MSDIDGDSTMHSSPDLDANDDEMFPDEMFPDETTLPSTPRNAANIAIDPTAELSPPNSQGPAHLPRGDSTITVASRINANGKRPLAMNAQVSGSGEMHRDPETGYSWSKQEDAPGFSWRNPRAKDEEHRALEQIIDKHLQVKAYYGDPLDSTIPAKSAR